MVEEGEAGKCFSNDDTCQLDYTTSHPTSNVIIMVTADRISILWTLAQQTTLFVEVLIALLQCIFQSTFSILHVKC